MNTTDALPDGLRAALGQIIADQRREWRRERELIEAQARETVAQLRAEIVELRSAIKDDVAARLAGLRDGAPGERGERGPEGLPGRDGTPGERGLPGEQGQQGLPGDRGEAGAAGERGERGEQGLPGERGTDGVSGARGEQGPPGDRGENGLQGEPGQLGEKGERGLPGERGADGAPGERGLQGERGEKGEHGAPGEKGLPGDRGDKGETGERGPEGAPGRLPVAKEWTARVHYEGNVVTHAGATYQALRDTGGAPPSEDWQLLAAKGADARAFMVRGTFDSEDAYEKNDVVAFNGSSFVALKDAPGACPGEGWQLLASAGRRGEKGQTGERGQRGDRGEKGQTGASIIAADIDGMSLVLTDSDGEQLRADFAPIAEQILAAAR